MAKDNKNINKKPKLNPYWIYGGIIIAAFIGYAIIFWKIWRFNYKKNNITIMSFLNMLENGDVEELLLINDREAKVYLTKEALELEVHS